MTTEAELYALMRQLDRLEELREDMLEVALRGGATVDADEDDDLDIKEIDVAALMAELSDLGLRTLDDVERRDGRALRIGEHQRPPRRAGNGLGRAGSVDVAGDVVGYLQGHRHRPARAIGEPAAARQARQIGMAEEPGQGRVRAGQQEFQVG